MKKKDLRLLSYICWSLLAMVIMLGGVSPVSAGEIGKTIDRTNVAQYKDVLIPALYRAIERGDFICPTADLPFDYKHDPKFLAAGEKNAGKFDVNAEGDLIDKSTGKLPKYNIYGYPFPHIDRNDPNIAVKIMWNFNFQRYRLMGLNDVTHAAWIDRKGEHRYFKGWEYFLWIQGRPPGQELKNPNNYLTMEMQTLFNPLSMKGTNTMAWDYFDERDITQFAYVPAFRRIRQTSGASRSDPYQGTDAWLDTNVGWTGKNRSMTWKLLGEKTILVPFTSMKKFAEQADKDGAMPRTVPTYKFGYQTPGWKGASWAPTNMIYVPRRVWVIEQIPKDRYYAWGVHIGYVDKETNFIWYKEVYDKTGEFRTWLSICVHYAELPDGRNNIGDYDVLLFIDEKVPHASTFGRDPKYPGYLFLPSSRLGITFYGMDNFMQQSK